MFCFFILPEHVLWKKKIYVTIWEIEHFNMGCGNDFGDANSFSVMNWKIKKQNPSAKHLPKTVSWLQVRPKAANRSRTSSIVGRCFLSNEQQSSTSLRNSGGSATSVQTKGTGRGRPSSPCIISLICVFDPRAWRSANGSLQFFTPSSSHNAIPSIQMSEAWEFLPSWPQVSGALVHAGLSITASSKGTIWIWTPRF